MKNAPHNQQSNCNYQCASLNEKRTQHVAAAPGGGGRRTLQYQIVKCRSHLSRHAFWET
jgi:hypothetical protein